MSHGATPQPASAARARAAGQLLRYAIVGVGANVALYAVYLALTGSGVGPKAAMTLAYAAGVVGTFGLNSAWTFGRRDVSAVSFARYAATHAVGYGLNLALLWLFVDQLSCSHRVVQATAILIVAGLLFTINKLWVFQKPNGTAGCAAR